MDFCPPLPARASPTRAHRPHVPCRAIHCAPEDVLGFLRSCPGRTQSHPTSRMVHGQGHRGRRGGMERTCCCMHSTLPSGRLLLHAGCQFACLHSRAQPREQQPSQRARWSRPLTATDLRLCVSRNRADRMRVMDAHRGLCIVSLKSFRSIRAAALVHGDPAVEAYRDDAVARKSATPRMP